MAISPDTNIKLLKCPLSMENKHQITFSDTTAQYNYFNHLPKIEIEESYYQRKDNIMRIPYHIDDIQEYNYVMYQNDNYSDKWFYAFIVNMEYRSDNLTYVTIGTDVFQTWQFDFVFKESFVEREHVSKGDDLISKNLEPENLEFGVPNISQVAGMPWFLEPAFVIAYSRNPYTDGFSTHSVSLSNLNGMPNGVYMYCSSSSNMQTMVDRINQAGYGQAIITLFTIPKGALLGYVDGNNTEWTQSVLDNNNFADWISSFKANPIEVNLSGYNGTFEGYFAKNNKLNHYPFSYTGINPPNRKSKNYKI